MKLRFIIIALIGCLFSNTIMAQENIKKAFDKFIASKNAEVSKAFSEERDLTKDNHPLKSKADIYNFTIKKKHRKLIDEVLSAFEKDRNNPNVYQVLTHSGGNGIPTNARELLVGNDRKNSIYIGMDEMQSWQLICLLDPTDKSRSHRYAYAIEWNDDPKQIYLSGKIRGKLVITYSVIPEDMLKAFQNQYKTTSNNISKNWSSEEIANEIYKMGLTGKYNQFSDKTQVLMAFEALKTEFLNGNSSTRQGGTLCMTIYALCSYIRPMLEHELDLRQKLRDDLNMMIKKCDKNTDLGKSNIGYLQLAIKRLQ